MNNIFKNWFFPAILAVALFVFVRPAFAQVIELQTDLAQYLTANNVEVGNEVVDGFHQIFYVYGGNKTFITEGNLNATSPVSVGEYIVYRKNTGVGTDDIFLYNILAKATVQLSHAQNNANPKINRNGEVVWEGWVDGGWQVFFFDGKSVSQLTMGDTSLNANIDEDFITYSRRDITGTWRAVIYSIDRKEFVDVTTGIKAKHFKLKDGKIILGTEGEEEEFPLTAEDLFVLDLVPLTSEATDKPETVTIEEIAEELEATVSADIDTRGPSLSPESTPQ